MMAVVAPPRRLFLSRSAQLAMCPATCSHPSQVAMVSRSALLVSPATPTRCSEPQLSTALGPPLRRFSLARMESAPSQTQILLPEALFTEPCIRNPHVPDP